MAKVPNHAALNRRVNGAWWDMYHPLHLYYFTLSSLKRLLENHSLTLVHAYSSNPYGIGCFLKDLRRHWKKNWCDTPQISIPAAASGTNNARVARESVAKTLWRLIDWAPKQLSLNFLAGNFLIVIAKSQPRRRM